MFSCSEISACGDFSLNFTETSSLSSILTEKILVEVQCNTSENFGIFTQLLQCNSDLIPIQSNLGLRLDWIGLDLTLGLD